MSLETYIERIKRIDKLIQLESTGTPKELSQKIGISERSIYSYISKMKELGAPIEYNEDRRSYFYVEPVCFEINFKKK